MNNEVFNFLAGLASFVGLFLTLYSIYQIKNIKESIKEYIEQTDLSTALNTMSEVNNLLVEILDKNILNDIEKLKVNNAIQDMCESIGCIKGVNRVYLNKISKVDVDIEYCDTGYYNDDFFNNIILKGKNKIIIFGKRNSRITKQENKIKFFQLLENTNVFIELFYIDPNASDEYIEVIRQMSPSFPNSNKEVRDSQITGKNTYINMKEKSKRADAINYYEYKTFPYFNFIVVDRYFYWGIVNYPKYGKNVNEYDLRPYIKFSINDRFPRYIMEICEDIKNECKITNNVY